MLKTEKHTAPLAPPSLGNFPNFMPTVPVPAAEFLMGTSDAQVRFLLMKEDWAREW